MSDKERNFHTDVLLDAEEYYLANNQGYLTCGNSMLWWAANDRGYTCDLKFARVWKGWELIRKGLRHETDLPYLKSRVDVLVQHHIDFQDLFNLSNDGKRRIVPHTVTYAIGATERYYESKKEGE